MNPEKFPEPEAEDESEKVDAEERIRLDSVRKELLDFQKKEENREIESSHLIKTPGHSGVDINSLTKKDLMMYEGLSSFTLDDLIKHREGINQKDENRQEFAAFLTNKAGPRLAQELSGKEKNNG